MEIKKGLALGGGGARGAFEAGFILALSQEGQSFDIITGTSVGALNGALLASGQIEEMLKIWENIETARILSIDLPDDIVSQAGVQKVFANFVKQAIKTGGVETSPLERLIHEVIDEEVLRKSPTIFGLVTTRVQGLRPLKLFVSDIPKGQVGDYLVASASAFPGLQPHKIGEEMFIDGGYSDNLPIQMLINKGASDIIAIDLSSPGISQKHKPDAGLKVKIIKPLWDLGTLLIFDAARSRRNIRLGYLEGERHLGKLEGHRYAFKNGEIIKTSRFLDERLKILLDKMNLRILRDYHRYSMGELISAGEMLKNIGKIDEKQLKTEDIVLLGIEELADLLKISPLVVYDNLRMNKAIELSLLCYENTANASDYIPMSEMEFAGKMLKGFRFIDRYRVFTTIYKMILAIMNGKDQGVQALAYSKFYPKEFAAAVYYYLLQAII